MVIDDGHLDRSEFDKRGRGNDDTPLVALVRDQPYTRGGLTSIGRTNSESYAAFVRRAQKEFKSAKRA